MFNYRPYSPAPIFNQTSVMDVANLVIPESKQEEDPTSTAKQSKMMDSKMVDSPTKDSHAKQKHNEPKGIPKASTVGSSSTVIGSSSQVMSAPKRTTMVREPKRKTLQSLCKKKTCLKKFKQLDKQQQEAMHTARQLTKDTSCGQCGNKIDSKMMAHTCKFCHDDFCKNCVSWLKAATLGGMN